MKIDESRWKLTNEERIVSGRVKCFIRLYLMRLRVTFVRFIQAWLEKGPDAGRRHLSNSRKFLNEEFWDAMTVTVTNAASRNKSWDRILYISTYLIPYRSTNVNTTNLFIPYDQYAYNCQDLTQSSKVSRIMNTYIFSDSCKVIIKSPVCILSLNLLATDFFQILAHPVFKMSVIQKPNKVSLWNKRHFEEKKMEIIQHV